MQLKMTWPSALQIICIVWVFLLVIHVSVQSSVVQAFETHCLRQIVLLYCNYSLYTSYMQVSRLSLQRRAVQITFLYCMPVVSICGPIQIPVDILKPVQAVERGVDKYTSLFISVSCLSLNLKIVDKKLAQFRSYSIYQQATGVRFYVFYHTYWTPSGYIYIASFNFTSCLIGCFSSNLSKHHVAERMHDIVCLRFCRQSTYCSILMFNFTV